MMKHRMTFVVGVALSGLLGLGTISLAEKLPTAVVAQMKSGMITAVGKDDIQINGSTYRIMEKATIVDHEGQLMEIEEVHQQALVQYLLKAGLIEAMIVTNPQ